MALYTVLLVSQGRLLLLDRAEFLDWEKEQEEGLAIPLANFLV